MYNENKKIRFKVTAKCPILHTQKVGYVVAADEYEAKQKALVLMGASLFIKKVEEVDGEQEA